MFPEWVIKHKRPGTTVKKIGNNYYLYYATSSRQEGKRYPVCQQTYIGKITPDGIVQDRVSINIGKTPASTLKNLVPGLEGELGEVIALYVKKEWICTQTGKETLQELERRGICQNGKVIHHNF